MVNIYGLNTIYMSKKFNKFETIFERAYSHHANGGFRTNTPVRLRPEFFQSDFYKTRYQSNAPFDTWIKGLLAENPEYFFFIDEISGNATNASAKDANDLAGSSDIMLTLKPDPRTLQTPTEFNVFVVPGDFKLIEVLDFGVNLPPVQGVPNKYEKYDKYVQVKPTPVDKSNIFTGNQPTDNALPAQNTSI